MHVDVMVESASDATDVKVGVLFIQVVILIQDEDDELNYSGETFTSS
jgi:hypothetical protein